MRPTGGARPVVVVIVARICTTIVKVPVGIIIITARRRPRRLIIIFRSITFGMVGSAFSDAFEGVVRLLPFGATRVGTNTVPNHFEHRVDRDREYICCVVEVRRRKVGEPHDVVLSVPNPSGQDFPAQKNARDATWGTFWQRFHFLWRPDVVDQSSKRNAFPFEMSCLVSAVPSGITVDHADVVRVSEVPAGPRPAAGR